MVNDLKGDFYIMADENVVTTDLDLTGGGGGETSETNEAPAETNEAPAETNAAPAETNAETTEVPVETTEVPVETNVETSTETTGGETGGESGGETGGELEEETITLPTEGAGVNPEVGNGEVSGVEDAEVSDGTGDDSTSGSGETENTDGSFENSMDDFTSMDNVVKDDNVDVQAPLIEEETTEVTEEVEEEVPEEVTEEEEVPENPENVTNVVENNNSMEQSQEQTQETNVNSENTNTNNNEVVTDTDVTTNTEVNNNNEVVVNVQQGPINITIVVPQDEKEEESQPEPEQDSEEQESDPKPSESEVEENTPPTPTEDEPVEDTPVEDTPTEDTPSTPPAEDPTPTPPANDTPTNDVPPTTIIIEEEPTPLSPGVPDSEPTTGLDEEHNFFQGLMNVAYEKFHFPVAEFAEQYGWVDDLHEWGYDIPGYSDPENGYYPDDYKKNVDEYKFSMQAFETVMQETGKYDEYVAAMAALGYSETTTSQNSYSYDSESITGSGESAYAQQMYTSFDGTVKTSEEFRAELYQRLDYMYNADVSHADSNRKEAYENGMPTSTYEEYGRQAEIAKQEFTEWYNSLSPEEQMGVAAMSAEWSSERTDFTYEEAVERVDTYDYNDALERARETSADDASRQAKFTEDVRQIDMESRTNLLSSIGINSSHLASALTAETGDATYVTEFLTSQSENTQEFVNSSISYYMYTSESAMTYEQYAEGSYTSEVVSSYSRYEQALQSLGLDVQIDVPESELAGAERSNNTGLTDNQTVVNYGREVVDITEGTGYDNDGEYQ